MSGGPPGPGSIPTSRLDLVPLVPGDAEEMVAVLADDELYAFIGGSAPTLDELRARYARQSIGHSADGSEAWHNWIIRPRPDGRAIGFLQATIRDDGRQAEVAWVVGLKWQGRGYATEASLALVAWLEGSGVRRITANIRPGHVASETVARRIGLVPTDGMVEGERVWARSLARGSVTPPGRARTMDGLPGGAMDRATWLREIRRKAEADFDTRRSATYDAEAEPMTSIHRRFVRRVVRTAPVGGTVLDAACGTGKYFGIVFSARRKVVGVDRSTGMLGQAQQKYPAAELIHMSLQELDLERTFDGVMCIDAMENVPPEDWPTVLANLHRALKSDGMLYLTVEEHAQADIDAANADALARGLPVVPGEILFHGSDYHFVPTRQEVADWVANERLAVIEEADSPGDGYSYWHLLMR